jgi:RsiW-degrading membrane proteinase PrsW (M82 family)
MNPLVHLFLAGFFSVVPMFFYLFIIWLMDRYEREPIWLLLLNFFWGATGAILFGIIGSLIMGFGITEFIYQFSNESDAVILNNLAGAVVVAPVVEEITKGIFLMIVALSRHFDGPVDGAVYGGAVGLGFGMTENFMYFMSYGNTMESLIALIIIRTLFSTVLHCCTQAVFGASIGFAKFRSLPVKMLVIPLGLLIAMFMHFMWNLTVSFESTALLGFVFMFFSIIIILVVFQFGVFHDHKIIKRELHEESTFGHIPPEHLQHLPFAMRRNKRGWLPNGVNQKEYVKTATKLAMRKHQSRTLRSHKLEMYLREIELLRTKLSQLLPPKNV